MKIILEENDSFIQPDGIATMIVVAVTKDDGKTVRFPYSAEKTMSALIADVNAKIGSAPVATIRERIETGVEDIRSAITPAYETIKQLAGQSNNKIQKEDLVKCIKLLPRIDKYAPIDMEVGGIYRVADVPHGKIPYYEVLDDTDYHKADIVRRIPAYPEEVEFFAKRKPPIAFEKGKMEQFIPCEICQKKVVGHKLDDEKYHANCPDCNHETVIEKVLQTA